MSGSKVVFSSSARDVSLDELRRREADARRAARQAALREEQKRRHEAEVRRRIEAAERVIDTQESRYQQLVARLDDAGRCLPDLSITAPSLSSIGNEIARNPVKLEAYASQLRSEVDRFSQQLDMAIAAAERLLERRLKTAAAWRTAGDTEKFLAQRTKSCRDDAKKIQEIFSFAPLPDRPSEDAELEEVESYVTALRQQVDVLESYHKGLSARVVARERATALGGTLVEASGIDEALVRYREEQKVRARAALMAHRDDELRRNGLLLEDLPDYLKLELAFAQSEAEHLDWHTSITRWLAREKQRRDGVARALELLRCAPELAQDTSLSSRWMSLVEQLQRVTSGLEAFTPAIEREYAQLHSDGHRLVNIAFNKADWVRAMADEGFEVLECLDNQGLILVDLDHPETWIEAKPLEAEEGGFGACLELKTDADAIAGEERVSDSVCAKLTRVAQAAGDGVSTEVEVIEQGTRISRARRPKALKQQF